MTVPANESQGLSGTESQGQTTEEVVAPVAEEVSSPESGTGINPAWSDFLDELPSSLHSIATPHLQKWDQNFQSKIQEVHSQYEPYKQFIENNVDSDQLNYALNVLQQIEENPAEVVKAIQAYIGEDPEQGQTNLNPDPTAPSADDLPEVFEHPAFKQMQETVKQMAQIMVQQRESQTQADADKQFEKDWETAKQTHGEFDEDFVLAKLYNNDKLTVDQAVKQFVDWKAEQEKSIIEKIRKPGPPVLNDGGSAPAGSLNPAKLNPKDRKNLVASLLAQAKSQES